MDVGSSWVGTRADFRTHVLVHNKGLRVKLYRHFGHAVVDIGVKTFKPFKLVRNVSDGVVELPVWSANMVDVLLVKLRDFTNKARLAEQRQHHQEENEESVNARENFADSLLP